jgi:hypothetical protein
MMKRWGVGVLSVLLLLNLYGCVALLAGAAGGAGTAAWLSGKLTQEVDASFDRTLTAVKSGLQSMTLKVTKETIKEDAAQVMSNYSDGRTIWVDIHRVTAFATRLEVRVGAAGDKEAAQKVLNKIMQYL